MITEDVLEDFNAVKKKFSKQEYIFRQGNRARNFYQIIKGSVKMCHLNSQGKEFVQGFFRNGQSFGEPPLFVDITYPAGAIAVKETWLWIISKDNFFNLLRQHPDIHMSITRTLSKRLYYKAMMASESCGKCKLLKLLHYLKTQDEVTDKPFKINFSRQELANLTGLRVETVIRMAKTLEKEDKLQIIKGKIYV